MRPVRVYLDQRDWIYLAQAHHGLERGRRYQPTLDRLRQEVQAGRVELPLSAIHFLETAQDKDADRRGRLATVMTQLSRCRTQAPLRAVTRPKLRHQIARALGFVVPTETIEVFGLGAHHAFAQPLDDPVLLLPVAFRELLAAPLESLPAAERAKAVDTMAVIRARRETEAKGIESWRGVAKQFSRPVRDRAYGAAVWIDNLDLVNELLAELGLPAHAVTALGHERMTEILLEVPELEVKMAMVAERNEHWDRAIDVNDDRDIDAVAMAVPNCNIVVTERFWCELVERRGLALRYATRMVDDLVNLPEALDALTR